VDPADPNSEFQFDFEWFWKQPRNLSLQEILARLKVQGLLIPKQETELANLLLGQLCLKWDLLTNGGCYFEVKADVKINEQIRTKFQKKGKAGVEREVHMITTGTKKEPVDVYLLEGDKCDVIVQYKSQWQPPNEKSKDASQKESDREVHVAIEAFTKTSRVALPFGLDWSDDTLYFDQGNQNDNRPSDSGNGAAGNGGGQGLGGAGAPGNGAAPGGGPAAGKGAGEVNESNQGYREEIFFLFRDFYGFFSEESGSYFPILFRKSASRHADEDVNDMVDNFKTLMAAGTSGIAASREFAKPQAGELMATNDANQTATSNADAKVPETKSGATETMPSAMQQN
jgi:hypothetical protein